MKDLLITVPTLDLQMGTVDLTTDDGLRSAVIISLMADRQVNGEGGWWGEVLLNVTDWGSRLWTLRRHALNAETVRLAEEYAREALTWLVSQGHVKTVAVSALRQGDGILLTVNIGLTATQSLSIPIEWRA